MSVSGISSSTNYYQPNVQQTSSSQRGADFKSLVQSLQSGDLSGAQSAYAALQQTLSPSTTSTSASSTTGSSGISSDFQALGQALQSGDLSAAQQALTKLQQDAPVHGGGHHHHHHGGGTPAATSSTATSTPSSSTVGTNVNVSA